MKKPNKKTENKKLINQPVDEKKPVNNKKLINQPVDEKKPVNNKKIVNKAVDEKKPVNNKKQLVIQKLKDKMPETKNLSKIIDNVLIVLIFLQMAGIIYLLIK